VICLEPVTTSLVFVEELKGGKPHCYPVTARG